MLTERFISHFFHPIPRFFSVRIVLNGRKELSLHTMTEGMIWQYIIVALIVVSAIGYAVWRIYRSVKASKDLSAGCAGCPFAGKCESKKEAACKAEVEEKLSQADMRKDSKARC